MTEKTLPYQPLVYERGKHKNFYDPARRPPKPIPPLRTFKGIMGYDARRDTAICPTCSGTGYDYEEDDLENKIPCVTCNGRKTINYATLSEIYFKKIADYRKEKYEWDLYAKTVETIHAKLTSRERAFMDLRKPNKGY
jgi:hypothetical protein